MFPVFPDLTVSYALALCLTHCFLKVHVINDYEDAIAIADKIVAAHSPGDSLTLVQREAAWLIRALVMSRSDSYSSPEYSEDGIHRIRILLSIPSLTDLQRTGLGKTLDVYLQRRLIYFGGDSGLTDSVLRLYVFSENRTQHDGPLLDMKKKADHLKKIYTAMKNGEITDIEEAVKRSRTVLPLHSSDRLSHVPAFIFANILFEGFRRTSRL